MDWKLLLGPAKTLGLFLFDVAFILQAHGWVRSAAIYTGGVLTGIYLSEWLLRHLLEGVERDGTLE